MRRKRRIVEAEAEVPGVRPAGGGAAVNARWRDPRLELADRLDSLSETVEDHTSLIRICIGHNSDGTAKTIRPCAGGKATIRELIRSLREAAKTLEHEPTISHGGRHQASTSIPFSAMRRRLSLIPKP